MNWHSNISALVEQFEKETLPKDAWTHEAHLATGLFYILNYGKDQAMERIRIRIKKFNIATGGENTDTSGYHETITVCWIHGIRQFLEMNDRTLSAETLFQQLVKSKFADKNFPLEFYSKERLFSVEARQRFIEPDIQTLP